MTLLQFLNLTLGAVSRIPKFISKVSVMKFFERITLMINVKVVYACTIKKFSYHQGKNLEIIDQTIIFKINIRRKKAYFVVVYRSPSQTDDEFDVFIDRLELTIENIQTKKLDCIIITGDFNCKSQK